MSERYPLHWPHGWRRTPLEAQQQRLIGHHGQSWDGVVDRLHEELRRLGANSVILSTNQPIRRDGYPYKANRIVEDPGAAVYFRLGKRDMAMAQDRYWYLLCNIRSLALAIEGLRQMRRHGGDLMMERAFTGFEALPAPGAARTWWQVLGVERDASRAAVDHAYLKLAKTFHPDMGAEPDHARMAEINAARDEASERPAA